jgi:thioredoxin type arsenate reductase
MTTDSRVQRMRRLLGAGQTLLMPDAYDPLSARIIESLGFAAVQCSGFSMAAAAACPSEAAFSRSDNLALTAAIVAAVRVPVMADGEDGFGGPDEVRRTVRAFAEVGVAGVNIEDQILRQPGIRGVVDASWMLEKLAAARKGALDAGEPHLVINARTDALATASDRNAGIEEAIRRANLYLAGGGDLAFVTAVATIEEAAALANGIRGPISIAAGMPYNLRTLPIQELRRLRVARVSLPALAILSSAQAMRRVLTAVRDTHDLSTLADDATLMPMKDLADLAASSPSTRPPTAPDASPSTHRVKVLFLCTGNSCRSQMAEGWALALKGDRIEPYSAGIEPHGLNPLAVKAMAEAGVDISRHRSKHVDELRGVPFDYVVTVCGHAAEHCPLFPGKVPIVHAGFDDPPRLAQTARNEEEALAHYRRVRDEIRAFMLGLPERLEKES